MKRLLFISMLFFLLYADAVHAFTVNGTITDQTGKPIHGVRVFTIQVEYISIFGQIIYDNWTIDYPSYSDLYGNYTATCEQTAFAHKYWIGFAAKGDNVDDLHPSHIRSGAVEVVSEQNSTINVVYNLATKLWASGNVQTTIAYIGKTINMPSVNEMNFVKITQKPSTAENIISISYADGLGRPVQTQTTYNTLSIVNSHTFYDAIGRPFLATKSFEQDFGGSYFVPNAIYYSQAYYVGQNADWHPYYVTKYFDDPLNRASAVGGPGTIFQPTDYASQTSSDDHSVRTRYTGKKNLDIDLPVTSKTVSMLNDLGDATNYIMRADIFDVSNNAASGRTLKIYDASTNSIVYSDISNGYGQVHLSQGIFYSILPKYPSVKIGVDNLTYPTTYSIDDLVHEKIFIEIDNKDNPTNINYIQIVAVFDPPFKLKYFHTTMADENGSITQSWKDLFDNVVQTYATDGANAIKTEYQYDILGNLLKTVPPKGANYATINKYNTLGQLIEKTDPDAGTTKYMYDIAGNLRFIQDAKMAAEGKFLINMYDPHSRVVRKYLCTNATAYYFQVYADIYNWPYYTQAPADAQYFKAVLDNVYDKLEESQKPPAASLSSAFQFTHLRGRLTKSIAYNYIDNSGYQVTNWYSYDNDGNLWLSIQDIPGDGLRVSAYSYDNLGRKTSERFYENAAEGTMPAFTRNFQYDAAGRLFKVTDTSGKRIIEYGYYPTGQVKYEKYGQKTDGTPIHVVEKSFTIKDWQSYSAGRPAVGSSDELTNGLTEIVAYNTGLSTPNSSGTTPGIITDILPQFNGSISEIVYRNATQPTRSFRYQYDNISRLRKADYGIADSWVDGEGFVTDFAGATAYDLQTAYDQNGNITNNFFGPQPTTPPAYNYYANTNRLGNISANVKAYAQGETPRNMSTGNNFIYDANGNMIIDKSKKMNVEYDWRNLPIRFLFYASLDAGGIGIGNPLSSVAMIYDASGNRVAKVEE